jgi:pilus assembly protein Flp/PilA
MKAVFRRLLADQSGATALEYALIGSVVSVAILAGVTALSGRLGVMYSNIAAKLS